MIPFSPPHIDQEIIDAVVETLKSGWITTGPKTKLFEKKITEYCGCKAAVCVNSATAGLEIMLRWFGVGEGDEVIVPAYTYTATANVVKHCGAKPVMVDAGNDFNVDVTQIEKAITPNTKAIMPVDFAGLPCDYDAINELVRRADVKNKFRPKNENQKKLGRIMVLADAAHSVGATYKGKKAGSLTDASVFSFHAVKNLTTAEGGCIALNFDAPFDNEELYKFLCIYILHGQNKDALAKMQKGNWRYDIIEAGFKCNMTDILAAIGLVEIARYDSDTLVKRKYICEKYSDAFAKKNWAEVPKLQTSNLKPQTVTEGSYHLYPLRIKGIKEEQRDKIIAEIFNKDVSVNVHFIPLPMFSYYKREGYKISDYPVAYDNYSREISLPVFYDLTDGQIQTVIEAVVTSVEKVLSEEKIAAT
ncbi:MAG TPA: DegT/DnrJ/EryC1/StrS family aminotransferase [Bacteroidia bacterium]|nr:DegT/DnrJ/EryC1/StrS family aminotransferase [Bacteroidia bacterium]